MSRWPDYSAGFISVAIETISHSSNGPSDHHHPLLGLLYKRIHDDLKGFLLFALKLSFACVVVFKGHFY